jgi:hypothetical protein
MAERFDPLLLPFIDATDDEEADRILERIFQEDTKPVVDRALAKFARASSVDDMQHASELSGRVLLHLVTRLRQCRGDPAAAPIADWRAYVATATRHECDEYLREKYPNRHRLKNRLRYVLAHQSQFAVWEAISGELMCGFAEWRNRPDTTSTYKRILEEPNAIAERPSSGLTANTLVPLLDGIFSWGGGPLGFNELVNIVAHLGHVSDRPVASIDGPQATSMPQTDPAADPSVRLAGREHLKRVWKEIRELPPRQRAALMLGLDDVWLFPMTGVASIRQIAAALERDALEFARLWHELPLDDTAIAAQLQMTRQQVVNLRKSARERLGRRMKADV